jgi:hypothetical protein
MVRLTFKGSKMLGLRPLGTICASLGLAFALAAAACLLPENPYQRWQLVDGTSYEQLRRAYERIHFDSRPIDIAIVGPSKTMLGLSAQRIEQQLSLQGSPASVENFSVPAVGRNAQWAVLDELFKSKSPKLIVLGVENAPYFYGHPAFKFVAAADAIAFPPAPLLHDYFYNLAYLPSRKLKLFAASFFPNLFGLRDKFDPEIYARTQSDFTFGSWSIDGKMVNMEREVPVETLLSQVKDPPRIKLSERFISWCCNDGDDHVYIREISRIAKMHGTELLFVFIPTFNGSREISDGKNLEQYGQVFSLGDLSDQANYFENAAHLNHAGATVASDRLANVIGGLNLKKSVQSTF